MIIGIAKPASGFTGGLELLTSKLAGALAAAGHGVSWLIPDPVTRLRPLGLDRGALDVEPADAGEYFRYVGLMSAFRALHAEVDVVLSTQPPSQAVSGPPQVALFYHHHRAYYDLSERWVAAGFADPERHLVCQRSIRRLDQAMYSAVSLFLAGSDTVLKRLQTFNGSDVNARTVRAPLLYRPPEGLAEVPRGSNGNVLCVSRHEFPKRTELLVAAMKLLPDVMAEMVGGGGRLGWIMAEDTRWTREGGDAVTATDPEKIWMRPHQWLPATGVSDGSNVRFLGWVSDAELNRRYADAAVVVAPAFDEDYGLTVLEAMAHGRPVVVCSDGGGLVETVASAGSGLVVAPDHREIAAAIRRLREDRDLALEFGARGREFVAQQSWSGYVRQVIEALEEQL